MHAAPKFMSFSHSGVDQNGCFVAGPSEKEIERKTSRDTKVVALLRAEIEAWKRVALHRRRLLSETLGAKTLEGPPEWHLS
jgi:hypothetical protein